MTDETERRTRKERIDPKLESLGWSVAPFDPARSWSYHQCAIEEYETDNTGRASSNSVSIGEPGELSRAIGELSYEISIATHTD
jgi:hypothetical protein